ARPLYTGTDVGFSTLEAGKDITYRFVEDVIGEVSALTPGPYLHIGGDEALSTSPEDYATFMARAQRIVGAHGKTVMAWHQLAQADVHDSAVVQYWGTSTVDESVTAAVERGARLVLSPAS